MRRVRAREAEACCYFSLLAVALRLTLLSGAEIQGKKKAGQERREE